MSAACRHREADPFCSAGFGSANHRLASMPSPSIVRPVRVTSNPEPEAAPESWLKRTDIPLVTRCLASPYSERFASSSVRQKLCDNRGEISVFNSRWVIRKLYEVEERRRIRIRLKTYFQYHRAHGGHRKAVEGSSKQC